MNKTVTFLMPSIQIKPSGGYKIVYEYANRLAKDNYSVCIVFPAWNDFKSASLKGKLRGLYFFIKCKYLGCSLAPWFELDTSIKKIVISNLKETNIPQSDIIIATGASTAIPLNNYRGVCNNNKYYFIQGYESWSVGEKKLLETYKLPLNKIVIADWLKEKVEVVGESAEIAYNGLNFNDFNLYEPIEKRDKYSIIMPYNKVKLKGCDIGLEALEIVHKKYPQLHVILYGVHKPRKIPSYCSFYYKPNVALHNDLYNSASIFLGPSFTEGFCLTVAEAMQCGCAAVCTNIGGYMVTCKDGYTALLAEVGNAYSMAQRIIELIEDDKLRLQIARDANKFIQQFTWDKAYKKLKSILSLQ